MIEPVNGAATTIHFNGTPINFKINKIKLKLTTATKPNEQPLHLYKVDGTAFVFRELKQHLSGFANIISISTIIA